MDHFPRRVGQTIGHLFVPVNLLLGKIRSVLIDPGLKMSAYLLPSAHPMKISSMMKSVVLSVNYSCSLGVYHEGVFGISILVRNLGMKILAAPNIAHLLCTSSVCTFLFNVSGSDPIVHTLIMLHSQIPSYFEFEILGVF